MTLRKSPSKRRWKTRAKAGKWIPSLVVFVLVEGREIYQDWEPHPTEKGFWKLRRSTEVTS